LKPTQCNPNQVAKMKTRILSSYLDSTTYEQTYASMMNFLSESKMPGYITVINAHTVVESVLNPDFGKIINEGFMALPDGRPLSVIARWKGDKNMKRVFGPTLMEKIINWGQGNQIKHFFFGSTQLILEKMSAVIQKKFPEAIVCGMISPPFKSLLPNENLEFISQINDLNPDIIWVGLGAPKQEKWMSENYQKLNKGIMIGIGAGFDYLAGETHHAPDWMKNYSLEWLYRLIQEPQRLWKRYLITNPLFILMNTLELLNLKTYD